MRFLGLLAMVELPLAALGWSAHNTGSSGAAGGVYWLLAFAAVILALVAVAAHHEGQAK